jgi:hypothetical protein
MGMWTDIRRRVLVGGESKRAVLRDYGIHWKTIDKVLANAEAPGYRQTQDRPKPLFDPFIPVVRHWLDGDKDVYRKQRHTAKRIFDRSLHLCRLRTPTALVSSAPHPINVSILGSRGKRAPFPPLRVLKHRRNLRFPPEKVRMGRENTAVFNLRESQVNSRECLVTLRECCATDAKCWHT